MIGCHTLRFPLEMKDKLLLWLGLYREDSPRAAVWVSSVFFDDFFHFDLGGLSPKHLQI
jgi:hypothetical protein